MTNLDEPELKKAMRMIDYAIVLVWFVLAFVFLILIGFFMTPTSASMTPRNVSETYIIWDVPGEINLTVDGAFTVVNVTDIPIVSLYGLQPNTPHYISNGSATVTTWTNQTATYWIIPWLILGLIFAFIAIGSRIPLLLILPIFLSTASIVYYLPTLPSDQYLFPAFILSLGAAFLAGWWGMRG